MQLSGQFLTSTARVRTVSRTPGGRLGEDRETWGAPGEPLPCAGFPASERAVRRAGLLGVTVTREVYLRGINLSPTEHRIDVDGTECHVRDVQEFGTFTIALCEEVG